MADIRHCMVPTQELCLRHAIAVSQQRMSPLFRAFRGRDYFRISRHHRTLFNGRTGRDFRNVQHPASEHAATGSASSEFHRRSSCDCIIEVRPPQRVLRCRTGDRQYPGNLVYSDSGPSAPGRSHSAGRAPSMDTVFCRRCRFSGRSRCDQKCLLSRARSHGLVARAREEFRRNLQRIVSYG